MSHLHMRKQSFRIRQRGQGMTEYIIITALIAIAAIGAVTYFGHVVRSQVGAMAHELSGHNADADISGAMKAGEAAAKQGTVEKTLNSYNNQITNSSGN
jgi:pilus assembly protein Flp/PilA